MTYEELITFIDERMRMSHVYQPTEKSGQRTRRAERGGLKWASYLMRESLMEPDYVDLAKAKLALEHGDVREAATHALAEWDLMFQGMLHLKVSEATQGQIERRYKKIAANYRPSWGLFQSMMDCRAALTESEPEAQRVAELLAGMDSIIEQGREAFRASGFD